MRQNNSRLHLVPLLHSGRTQDPLQAVGLGSPSLSRLYSTVLGLLKGTTETMFYFYCSRVSSPRLKKLSGALLDPHVGQRAVAADTVNSFPANLKNFSLDSIPNLILSCNHIFIPILVSVYTFKCPLIPAQLVSSIQKHS